MTPTTCTTCTACLNRLSYFPLRCPRCGSSLLIRADMAKTKARA